MTKRLRLRAETWTTAVYGAALDTGAVAHPTLRAGTWYVTATFGSGAAGASHQLLHPPSSPS